MSTGEKENRENLEDDVSSDDENEILRGFYPEQDELTEEWAHGVLETAGVTGVTQVVIDSWGLSSPLSRILGVTLYYKISGNKHSLPLIVKKPPRDPVGRLFITEAQFDVREIMFYTKMVPALNNLADEVLGPGNGMPVPRCVKAVLPDEFGGDSELVLEDMNGEDFQPAMFVDGLTEKETRTALFTAARFHALSLGLIERGGPLNQQFDFLFPCERAAAGYLRLIRRGLPQLEHYLRDHTECADESVAIGNLTANGNSLLNTLLEVSEPVTLVHADFWCGNLLFRERNDVLDCIVLDWQMVSLGKPMDDVALLLLSSLTPQMRRSMRDTFIEEYADKLEFEAQRLGPGAAAAAAEIRRDLKADWPRSALRALLLCAGSVDVAEIEPRAELRLIEAIKDLYAEGVLNLEADG